MRTAMSIIIRSIIILLQSVFYYVLLYVKSIKKERANIMESKKKGTRFTIQFNRDNPLHLQVVEILNRQDQRGKARYIVDAVLHYENCDTTVDIQKTASLDEKSIEAIVRRVFLEAQKDGGSRMPATAPAGQVEVPSDRPSPDMEYKTFDEVMDSLGEDGLKNVADALDMFRKK